MVDVTLTEQEQSRPVRSSSRAFKAARTAFYEEGRRLDADPTTRHLANCWLCRQRIDYDAAPGSTPDSHELDHYHPVSTHPELQEDPDNFRHAHRLCNQERGKEAPTAGLGEPVPDWWDSPT